MQPYVATDIKKEKELVIMIFSEMMIVQNPEKVIQGLKKIKVFWYFRNFIRFSENATHI